ncbi:hypothetical protein CYMTET_28722 [Cymbomonas tetramitiformis]|uniref:Uncharacterized protein n=1 Tax=Cymbomonas tetramitiformis TaxID=36881 RepID=A0AAE0FMP8_9CHLO|nr:hypothetical protein CYMTET_28722 [Cymbomonas tetramitiformis]
MSRYDSKYDGRDSDRHYKRSRSTHSGSGHTREHRSRTPSPPGRYEAHTKRYHAPRSPTAKITNLTAEDLANVPRNYLYNIRFRKENHTQMHVMGDKALMPSHIPGVGDERILASLQTFLYKVLYPLKFHNDGNKLSRCDDEFFGKLQAMANLPNTMGGTTTGAAPTPPTSQRSTENLELSEKTI